MKLLSVAKLNCNSSICLEREYSIDLFCFVWWEIDCYGSSRIQASEQNYSEILLSVKYTSWWPPSSAQVQNSLQSKSKESTTHKAPSRGETLTHIVPCSCRVIPVGEAKSGVASRPCQSTTSLLSLWLRWLCRRHHHLNIKHCNVAGRIGNILWQTTHTRNCICGRLFSGNKKAG